jgi:hypothetical protein
VIPSNVDDAIGTVRADEALNAMNPGSTERRTSVEFYEMPVQTVT